MLRLEIPDDLLLRAVSDACSRQLQKLNDIAGYVDIKGACKFMSVGETQFKEWVKLGLIHPRKISTHLVRFHLGELTDFMEQFKVQRVSRSSATASFEDTGPGGSPENAHSFRPH